MKHKAQCNHLYASMDVGSPWNISSAHRCNITSHGDHQISNIASANTQLNGSPALHLHEVPFPSWKLYENPFFVDGKLVAKYVSRYVNAPMDHAANSFTSASKGCQDKAPIPAGASRHGFSNPYSVDNPSMAPGPYLPRNVLNPAFWEHHEVHRISQAQDAPKPSDLVNVQAQGQPVRVAPFDSLKWPSLHLNCQVPNVIASGEEPLVSQPRANMAACSIQATLASILQRLRIVEDSQSRSNAVIAKLRLEMEDGSSRIQELEFSHESALREINSLLQSFGEQMTTSRRKEQERLRIAFARLHEEIEEERNTCRLLKLQNKQLMKELGEASMAAADAGNELDRERQARELMEEVCNELAREIGEDKVVVEQLKQEQAKSREKVEEELKIMRMAALWKDERVKMKISEAELELDDKHHLGMPSAELKSRVEEFVSTVSVASCEAYKAPNDVCEEEKQKKIIEQATLLRHALELSMQQVVDKGGALQVQTDMDLKEGEITIPIIEDQHIRADFCDCCSDKAHHECENDQSMSSTSHVELQVRPGDYMVHYSKKPSKVVRRPRMRLEDDLFNHSGTMIPHTRKYSRDNEVEAEREGGSRRIIFNAEYVQALNQRPSPERSLSEGYKRWFRGRKLSKVQSPPGAVSVSGRGEANESDFDCSLPSSHASPMKAAVHEKQSLSHFEARHNCIEKNGDVWDDDVTPNARGVNCYSEDDVSQVCMDGEGVLSMGQQSRNGCPAFSERTTNVTKASYPRKSQGLRREEHLTRDCECIGHNGECFMHHEYEDVKSLCADGAESAEDEHSEFDGFYYEPVMDDDLLQDDCSAHYRPEPDVDNRKDVADHEDEQRKTLSKAVYNRPGLQNRCFKELTCKSQAYDGGGWKNAKCNGTSAKSSRREEPLPVSSSPPLHKLVLPTPSAIRVPSVKSQYSSPRNAARSLSPSKPQVLQCFRPPTTSPEHDSGKVVVRVRSTAKGEGVDPANAARLGEEYQGKEACASSTGTAEEKKGNSLRAELLKARELDLEPVNNHNVNNKPVAPQTLPNKSSSPSSSFRFSPLRRSLTSTSRT
ncbi:hypothetical protein GOP47_0017830 [Adiantum capillus-veneris]|uniref:Uncharacterized protein n=1 Tax=Adiantum capillus-veneris TaxID=13818 RepID=A0A9D4UGL0_ADICA|nr:hypothetical protein GOP47_0017830 [Adiantum capillus-veneris]